MTYYIGNVQYIVIFFSPPLHKYQMLEDVTKGSSHLNGYVK